MHGAFVYGLGVAVSPIATVSVLFLLTCERAAAMGSCFAARWVAGVAVLAAVAAVLVEPAGVSSGRPIWITVFDVVVGAGYLLAAAAVARSRSGQSPSGAIVSRVDGVTPSGAVRLGVVVSAANPKVLALSLGAALAIAADGGASASFAEGAALFTVLGTFAVAVPLGAYFAVPSSRPALTRARVWIARHEKPVLTLLGLAIGMVFLLDGLR
jgi:hypothetical protein